MEIYYHFIPWIIAIAFAIHSLFSKDDAYFRGFCDLFVAIVFIIFVYQSLIYKVQFRSMVDVLPLHLMLLFFISCFFTAKRLMTYENMYEFIHGPISWIIIFTSLVSAISFFYGSWFLGYGQSQYFVTFLNIMFIAVILVGKKGYSIWITKVISVFVVLLTFFCYFLMCFRRYGLVDIKSISLEISYFLTPLSICFLIFLTIIGAYRLTSEKTWGKLLTIYFSLILLGFVTVHPEISTITKPVVNEIMQVASATGCGGTTIISLGMILKSRVILV